MKLYYAKGACSLAIRIIMHEIGMHCEYETVDLRAKKTQNGHDFLTINAKGSVPALLMDDGHVMTENAVIQQHLADKYSAHELLPPVPQLKRYRVLEWLNFVSTDIHCKGFAPLFNPAVPQEVKDKVFKPLLESKLSLADHELAKHRFLLGDEFTLGDVYLFVVLRWLKPVGMELSQWKNLSRFVQDAKKRPAVQAALDEEQLAV